MKVAHYSIFAPNRCGLYHTAKELVLAERLVGIDAGLIAYDKKEICKERGIILLTPSYELAEGEYKDYIINELNWMHN